MCSERLRVLLATLLLATLAPATPAQDATAIERRIDAIGRQLDSDAARRIEASENGEARDLLARTRQLREAAHKALADGDVSLAEQQVGLALRAFYTANAKLSSGGATTVALERRNAQLREEIAGYLQAFDAGLLEKGPAFANLLDRARFEDFMKAAEMYAGAGDLSAAQQGLNAAYEMVVAAITRLRQNDTLVHVLDFRTPADEYRYELDRHAGLELLVQQLLTEQPLQGGQAALVERYLGEARKLSGEAREQAARGDHETAIKTMEDANKNMVRSLQMMGVGISG